MAVIVAPGAGANCGTGDAGDGYENFAQDDEKPKYGEE